MYKASNGWKEIINGHDNEFFLRFNLGNIADIIGKTISDDARKDFLEINLDHIKMVQYKYTSNNNYNQTAANPTLAGGTLGNEMVMGRMVTRNGKVDIIEFIKAEVYKEGTPRILRSAVGDTYTTGTGADTTDLTGSDSYGPGFYNELTEDQIDSDNLLAQRALEGISYSQLPVFDLIVLSKTKDGKSVKARNIIKGVQFTSKGHADGVDALEMNSVMNINAKSVTGWIAAQ